ncbi:alanyl-tRNA synthetase [Myxococcus stipitatus DSM 14675]|uniref:Alanyl-tRNA synthetase n=1 Tax=Myxococcus stipitatus (strain DSM 14675 / JCM 12634 / Mx s8) TaxID=1278073 RepID=L7ULK5_MYXSD|nr:alanyl-tRNA editing protein [Myxococcus stipitatus]AGC47349.1 alanyl-tRNA synthetase [Myxococcus stipitatus DSM 14675]
MSTERLYFDDPFLHRFTARVVAHGTWNGAASVVLDRTAFYPEAGGQMADHGVLGGLPVRDVQVDDAGTVHHLLDVGEAGALPAPGLTLDGVVEAERRRVHMSLHTGQHMLSRALLDIAGAATVSSRLGAVCTIDTDQDTLDEQRVAEAEAHVNATIDADLPIRAFFPTPEELAALPLRRAPKVTDHIRVIQVGDFDVSPCGGTHCTRTGQVGLVRVLGVERYKGKGRVLFSAGPRARKELWEEAGTLRALSRAFTCGPLEVPTVVDKLRRELAEAREALGAARAKRAEHTATELAATLDASANKHVVAVLEGAGPEELRAVAARLTSRPDAVVFLAGRTPEGLAVLIARGAASAFGCGAFLKRAAAASGGRGGGRPEHAEGRLPASTDWPALVASLPT